MGLSLIITGAEGFLGRAVTRAARARGHAVRALGRADLDPARDEPGPVLAGADCVIHLAGSLSGDRAVQARDTLGATERLIAALSAMPLPPRVVLASSVAVYDADASGIITEATPIEPRPARRDAYAQAKLAQEAMLRASGLSHTILRPGAILGPGRIWNAHLGPVIGGVLVMMEQRGEVPLVSIDDCAQAFVLAAEGPGEGRALNILGRDRPTRARFVAALRAEGWPRHVLPLNWRVAMPLAWCLAPLGARVPGLLRPAVLRARMAPVTYDIAAAEAALGWTPAEDFETALARAREGAG